MRAMVGLARRGAALLFLFIGAWTVNALVGCDEGEGLPPPRPGTPTTTGAGTGSGGAGGAGEVNLCECIAHYSLPDTAECAACFLETTNGGSAPCYETSRECDLDPGCTGIEQCMSDCGYTPGCISQCALPFTMDDGHRLFQATIECACSRCSDVCTYPQELACDGTDGDGGAGGMGSGGAGGAP